MAVSNKTISENDIDIVEEMLKEATAEEEYDNITIDWQKLQAAAKKFVLAYNKLLEEESLYNKNILKTLINNPENINYIKGLQGGDQAYFVRAKYLLAFDFDEKLTKFLNELPKEAIYVYESNGKVQTFAMPIKKLAKYADKYGRLSLSLNQLKTEQQDSIENAKDGLIAEEHIKKAQAAYIGTNNRLNRFYQKAGLSGSCAQGGLLMWKKSKRWAIARVANRGDLKEAYANFLLTQHQSSMDHLVEIAIGKPSYYSHDLIQTFFEKYIYNVTNKPAIVEEDIVTDKTQYSVKSARASLPALSQYLSTAQWISEQQNILNKEELKAHINEEFPQDTHRNLIVNSIENLTEHEINTIAKLKRDFLITIS